MKKRKKFILGITSIVILGTIASVFYQFFILDSTERDLNSALLNSDIIKYQDKISDTICEFRTDHGFDKFVLCNSDRAVYYGHSDSEESIETRVISFIQKGKTVLYKAANDSSLIFRNGSDSLVIIFHLFPENHSLYRGHIAE